MRELRDLELRESELTTDTLQLFFTSLLLLRFLTVSTTNVTSLKGIENLRLLTTFFANGCAIDDEGVSYLTALSSIESLELVTERDEKFSPLHYIHLSCVCRTVRR